ncbi:site-specific DNA-methyltransferase [Psittacicella melopsittaci]|nr:site-specific DNA-methyltransferase [Psittacicella melopsittaci]
MLAPKVFTAAKRYTAQGIEENITLRDDDNLIIKGNNLIALASLLKRYEGKVKCIYIDPPYNTGNDSFLYNDSFNHSTWLTFMKNRLELARKLLSDDGVIFVQCDDNEQAYLKVLMDEVFSQHKFICNFMWMKTSTPPSLSKQVRKKLEYILCYGKEIIPEFNGGEMEGGDCPLINSSNSLRTLIFKPGSVKFHKGNQIINPIKEDELELKEQVNVENGFNTTDIILTARFKWTQETIEKEISLGTEFIVKNNIFSIRYARKGTRIKRPSNIISKVECGVGTNEEATKEIQALFGDRVFTYSKPESLLKYLLRFNTTNNDIVLDFFTGSGTTCAVAHKMGLQYIGVEQMDYITDVTVPRLQKVIEGEQGGVSKDLNWQGGGSFVYCELLEDANALIKQIEQADESNIKEIKQLIYTDSRIIPYLTQEELNSADSEFAELTLADKKQALIRLINKNKLYVNYADIADSAFAVSDSDKQFSKSFYEEQ